MNERREIRFLLNHAAVTLADVAADETLLDYLRLHHGLTGTKEGCAEGDCGACTVLVGALRGGKLVYETVNACIRFVASLDGTHVVTVEHLGRGGALHPVQRAMVEHHASQCGFCTPGIVMSLYALWLASPRPAREEVERALQGNLCRCTGYASIIRAAQDVCAHGDPAHDPLCAGREATAERLRSLTDGRRVRVGPPQSQAIIPADAADLAAVLTELPDARIVAGSSDVGLMVTKMMRNISPAIFIGGLADLARVEVGAGRVRIGAGVTFTEARDVIARTVPGFVEVWDRIGGRQVRNMGTVGGNIANGSPIGDTPPMLIALGASITLRGSDGCRQVRLEDYFIEYGRQDRHPGEFLEWIEFPIPAVDEQVAAYKVSKRPDEDISAVLGAFRLCLRAGAVDDVAIAYGGLAGTPKRARAVEASLAGRPWSLETVRGSLGAYDDDFKPLTDWRATAAYRLAVAKNLLVRFYHATAGEPGASLGRGREEVPA